MAQILRVKVPPRVVTAKCSEPQAVGSNAKGGEEAEQQNAGACEQKPDQAKWWIRLRNKPKSER